MNKRHFPYWPKRLSKTLTVPETTIVDHLETTAKRYPQKTAIHYYGSSYSYKQLWEQVNALAGYLQQKLSVQPGDRVLLYMQNSPQFIISYYAILRAEAIVVPINPMNTTEELSFYVKDCETKLGIVGQELFAKAEPLLSTTPLEHIIVAAYSDYISESSPIALPDEVALPRQTYDHEHVYYWTDCLETNLAPNLYQGHVDDIAVLPYTSGTTGVPKGCVHSHRTVNANIVGAYHWANVTSDSVCLVTLPLFHVTGMVHSMHLPIFAGSAMVMMTRWNRDSAAYLIEMHRCTHWVNISTMLIDFLANPSLSKYDISSLVSIAGGGAPLPEAVGEKLFKLTGVKYMEGYGLSETISQTHFNPPDRPKLQCLGIPSFDVDARIIDPATGKELGVGEVGEIVVHGPQVFKGYYRREKETEEAFIELDGKRFFRTGDIGRMDEEGYFFIVDRVKRMINASGYKVWPTEVESLLYKHPAVQQACVVGVPDPRRGETVKAFIVLQDEYVGKITEEEIIEWAKTQMAAYKYPRLVEFRSSLPMTSSGKLLWRKLQEEEYQKLEKGAKA
ncbi:long-chain-fatty-acid--CoA ligase [Parageobacillus genomosp. 1]|uniref:Long-chain-fatty-acid--CoA ligase n=1 Tax=Parageobacillus genomosp. 1 TaxID=1295642 RepID=A0ABC9VF38_9BACL|nr:long-chain fatty acid--CoA ligase [Parageobacillus genomosp. 1]EZP76956.1 long-chain-fatty-acid--CoA ligase [Parageobacillus genomosp. 1]